MDAQLFIENLIEDFQNIRICLIERMQVYLVLKAQFLRGLLLVPFRQDHIRIGLQFLIQLLKFVRLGDILHGIALFKHLLINPIFLRMLSKTIHYFLSHFRDRF